MLKPSELQLNCTSLRKDINRSQKRSTTNRFGEAEPNQLYSTSWRRSLSRTSHVPQFLHVLLPKPSCNVTSTRADSCRVGSIGPFNLAASITCICSL